MLERIPFRTEVLVPEPGVTRVVVTGHLDYDTAAELSAMSPKLFTGNVEVVELDLAGLTFIDSSGMAALIHVYNAAEEARGKFRIVALTPYLSHLFQVTALDKVFDLPS
ncbi:STAS domain-containing protein [Planobispora takensis]|uniref:STAS domain-containing protein n=1 Tax=Planobispora takensis TaxID=1367882 RepID=A0A8J3WUF4_9ACTN|nr:STAS domain-containing protein [Planobispora takensis]GII02606.1 hypothetical protein Pta02_46140 [Planobispora takensis]